MTSSNTEAKIVQKIKNSDGSFVTLYPTTLVDSVLMSDKETTLLSYINTLVNKITELETQLSDCKSLVTELQNRMVSWE